MNEEEKDNLFKDIFNRALKKMAENPQEMFDLNTLLKKYNNLLKEKIKLQQELKEKESIIDEARELIKELDDETDNGIYEIDSGRREELLSILGDKDERDKV